MKKTLLVLGAGSSKSLYKFFPTGLELIQEINKNFSLDFDLEHGVEGKDNGKFLSTMMNTMIEAYSKDLEIVEGQGRRADDVSSLWYNFLLEMKNLLWKTQVSYESLYYSGNYNELLSIDYFVTKKFDSLGCEYPHYTVWARRKLVDCLIKSSIYYIIKGAENSFIKYSYGRCGQLESSPNMHLNWIRELVESISLKELQQLGGKLYVLDFNYDRVFEYVFQVEIERRFGPEVASKITGVFLRDNVKHPYKSLGSLFELDIFVDNNCSQQMKFCGEKIDLMRSFYIPDVGFECLNVEQVAFVGFGYDQQNLKLVSKVAGDPNRWFGTSVGIPSAAKEKILITYSIELLDNDFKKLIRNIVSNLD